VQAVDQTKASVNATVKALAPGSRKTDKRDALMTLALYCQAREF
jgi:hypothetical protein